MMMVPRSFARSPPGPRSTPPCDEKRPYLKSTSPPRSDLAESLSDSSLTPSYNPITSPVKIPSRTYNQPQRPAPTTLQVPTAPGSTQSKRRESVKDILSSTTIPVRRKPRARPGRRLPNCDHVADFSKLLRDDVSSTGEGSLSASWSNPHFEGLFGNIDGLVEGQMIVGSEGVDAGIMTTRSLSSDSMPSLASPDDYSSCEVKSIHPQSIRSPSDHRLRQMASSEDCSAEHPLLSRDEEMDDLPGIRTPELIMSPLAKSRRDPSLQRKQSNAFKSTLTASLKALKSAAQTVSHIATTPPLIQPDEFLGPSIFDFKPGLTDDRRPPPSDSPPSAAMRRYLNPRSTVPSDSPAQLHFWLDEKPIPGSSLAEKPKIKVKKKYQIPASGKGPISRTSQLPPVVPLATCIPSAIRTPHASSPPTWLEPDGTPSNKSRAAQTLTEGVHEPKLEGQPRHREPRDNRDFLRVYVCELRMRQAGKLADEAAGHAKLWLPPIVEAKDDKGVRVERKVGNERWTVWTLDEL